MTWGEVVFTRYADGIEVERADNNTLISREVLDQLPSGPMDLVYNDGTVCSLATCTMNHVGRCYANSLVRITSRHGQTYDYRIGQYQAAYDAWEAWREH